MFEKSPKIQILSKMQLKSNKRRRIPLFKMLISDFPKKNNILPKSKKLFYTFYKIQFKKNNNTVRYIVDPYLEIMYVKCQADMSIFGKHIT